MPASRATPEYRSCASPSRRTSSLSEWPRFWRRSVKAPKGLSDLKDCLGSRDFAVRSWFRERLLSLRLLGRLPLKIDAARSGGRRPRSLDGGNRGPGWRVGAAPAAYLWGFEIGA